MRSAAGTLLNKFRLKVQHLILAVLKLLLAFIVSQLTWLLLLAVGGAAAVTTGVFVMYGPGFALIAGGCFAILGACVIFRGMGDG